MYNGFYQAVLQGASQHDMQEHEFTKLAIVAPIVAGCSRLVGGASATNSGSCTGHHKRVVVVIVGEDGEQRATCISWRQD